jgi:hypothetical protein
LQYLQRCRFPDDSLKLFQLMNKQPQNNRRQLQQFKNESSGIRFCCLPLNLSFVIQLYKFSLILSINASMCIKKTGRGPIKVSNPVIFFSAM